MTTTVFWIDLAAYSLTTLVATSLLLVLGAGIRRALNLSFALLMAAVALWAGSSVALRVALSFDTGLQQFWMELSTLSFMLAAPLLLIFSGIYVQSKRKEPYIVAAVSLVAIGLFSIPLFRHQVITNVRLSPRGVVIWDRTPLGFLTSIPLLISPALALSLLWSEWRRLRELHLPLAFTALVISGLLFSLVHFPFPTLSLVMIVVSALLGYGVLNRQLFNPLRELTDHLEQQVAIRTQELEETAGELQQAFLRVKRHAAYLQTAAKAARSVSAIRDVDRLLRETVQLISDRFGFYHAGIFLLDEDRECVVLRAASSGGGLRMVKQGYEVQVGTASVVGYVAGTGEPHIALDTGEGAVQFDNPNLPQTRSEMALPLKVHDQPIGVLDVQSAEEAFTDEDVAVLQILADQLAVGIENARLFARTQSSLEELNRLYRSMTAQAWEEFVDATRPGLRRYWVGSSEVPEGMWDSLFAQARKKRQPVSTSYAVGEDGGEHALAVPVKLRGVPVGVLGFNRPIEVGAWRPEEIELAQGIAERVALALENVRLLEQAQQHTAREQLARQVVDRIRQAEGVEQALRMTASELSEALDVPHVSIKLDLESPRKTHGQEEIV
ncbi:MAG: GAF domain-containing protein [Anaerolineae bacterium]|jgi:GAF domain-containing protein